MASKPTVTRARRKKNILKKKEEEEEDDDNNQKNSLFHFKWATTRIREEKKQQKVAKYKK